RPGRAGRPLAPMLRGTSPRRWDAGPEPERPVVSLLTVRGLSKSFGGLRAVSDVSFSVEPGSVVGLIGPNAAGKTTTFALRSAFQRPSAGRVALQGEPIPGLSPDTICQRGLTRTFQIMQAFPKLTLLHNVMIGAYARHRAVAAARRRALEVLERFGMVDRRQQPPRNPTLADLNRL